MAILRLQQQRKTAVSEVNGRAYFKQAAREMKISGLDPDAIQALPPLNSKRGSRKSRVGGRITWDLTHLSAEETEDRAKRSEDFLKQEPVVFDAEEEGR